MGLLKGPDQHLRVLVADKRTGIIEDIEAMAAKEVAFYTLDAAGVPVLIAEPPAEGEFYVKYKDAESTIFTYKIPATRKYNGIIAPTAAVNQESSLDLAGIAVSPNQDFLVRLVVPGYGGMISPEDDAVFYGTCKATASDNIATVTEKLANTLSSSLSRAAVEFASVSYTSGDTHFSVGALDQPFEFERWSGGLVRFDLFLTLPIESGKEANLATSPKAGTGTYKQVAAAEDFYLGYSPKYQSNVVDEKVQPVRAADPTKTYSSITVNFEEIKNGSGYLSQKQTLVVYYAATGADAKKVLPKAKA
jgi:hypothetical protein